MDAYFLRNPFSSAICTWTDTAITKVLSIEDCTEVLKGDHDGIEAAGNMAK